MIVSKEVLGLRILRARRAIQATLPEMEVSGVSKSSVCRAENGQAYPSLPNLILIARALELDLNELLADPRCRNCGQLTVSDQSSCADCTGH